MNAIFVTLIVLILIACVLLVLVVLLQNGKGDSLASNFVAGNQTFGVRQTANMLEKVTWGLVTFILLAAVVSSFTLKVSDNEITNQAKSSEQIDYSQTQQATPIDLENPATETTTETATEQPAK